MQETDSQRFLRLVKESRQEKGDVQSRIFLEEMSKKTCSPVLKQVLRDTDSIEVFDVTYGILLNRGFKAYGRKGIFQ